MKPARKRIKRFWERWGRARLVFFGYTREAARNKLKNRDLRGDTAQWRRWYQTNRKYQKHLGRSLPRWAVP